MDIAQYLDGYLIDIKEIEDNCLTTAILKTGSLRYSKEKKKWARESYANVVLRFLCNPQNEITDKILSSHLLTYNCYGVTQNPDTKDYNLVYNINNYDYCEKCRDTDANFRYLFEWIPHDALIYIEEMENNCLTTAIWKDGRLSYDKYYEKRLESFSYDKVTLRFLYDLQDTSDDELLKKVESYLLPEHCNGYYGISQNPDSKVYILVFNGNFINWTSGKERIDDFIQKMQLKIDKHDANIFEWISYNEFIGIKEIKDNCLFTAIWKKGPLSYKRYEKKLIRKSDEKVYLKYLHNSQDINESFFNKIDNLDFGISQNPDTKIYILVSNGDCYCEKCGNKNQEQWCKQCQTNQFKNDFMNWTSENAKLDEFIQKIQLKINRYDDAIFEWIPYHELIEIEKLDEDDGFATAVESYLTNKLVFGISQDPITKVYILIFNNDVDYCIKCGNEYEKKWCKTCQISHLKNNFTNWTSGNKKFDEFIQKSQLKIDKCDDTIIEWIPYNKIIGINEIGNSGFATAIWKDGPLCYSNSYKKYRRRLNEKVLLKYLYNLQYTEDTFLNEFEIDNKICILCQTKHENPKISELIQEIKLNIDLNSNDFNIKFEWIPYDQFNDIEEIGKGGFSTVYSAIWEDGLLTYEGKYGIKCWKRKPNTRVALKCLYNSQNYLDEFINEVRGYSNRTIASILKIYGISQNPNTKDYIMVLEYAEDGDFNNYLNKNYENFDWFNGIKALYYIIIGLNKIHEKQMVHRDFHIGNILFTKYDTACISDLGLCRKIGDTDEKNIYGVMPYVAPEVLGGKPYTQAADIYSFGMIMYVVATGKQPFADCAHDEVLAINISRGNRPEISDQIAPKCYTDLMKRCLDSNPDNRPNSIEIKEMIELFYLSLIQEFKKKQQHYEIEKQFNETQEYRKANFLSIKNNQLTTHMQAIYTSRLLNPFTKKLSKYR
ncbi:hypothetical protein RclHR1_00810003 [Rhizophagus clarus]|uniref:Protein kinase domain-containing protein n=1 Tax=Rhizophagus clarus TaxID=94130 RepID=A0A2Z6S1P5_9GLOM|nr:hypothetical protein RclHR1_00810003 [Rhizophagus clarus]